MYYSLHFEHSNPDFIVVDRDQIEELVTIEKALVEVLNEAGVPTRHEHSDEQGNLRRFALSDLSEEGLIDLAKHSIAGLPLVIVSATKVDGERDEVYVAGKRVRLDQIWQ